MKITRYKRNKNGDIINKCSYNIGRSFGCADSFTQYSSTCQRYDFNILSIENHDKFFKENPKLINVIEKLDGKIENKEIIFDSKHKAIFTFRIIRMTSTHFKNILDILYDILEKSNLGIFNALQLMELLWGIKYGHFTSYGVYKNYNIVNIFRYSNKDSSFYNTQLKEYIKRNKRYTLLNYKNIIQDNEYYIKKYNEGFVYLVSTINSKCLFDYKNATNITLRSENETDEYFKFCSKTLARMKEISKFKRYGAMLNAFKKLNEQIETKY